MGSMHLRADIRQSQTLSPRLQLAVRMLQMSSLDFAPAVVRSKLEDNPFLEDPQDAQYGEYEQGLLDGKELGEEGREGGMGRLAPEAGLAPDTGMDDGIGMGIGMDMDRDLPGMQHPPDPADHLPGPATEPADDRDLWLADAYGRAPGGGWRRHGHGSGRLRDHAGHAPARPAQCDGDDATRPVHGPGHRGRRWTTTAICAPTCRSWPACWPSAPHLTRRKCSLPCAWCNRWTRPAWPPAAWANACCCNARRSAMPACAAGPGHGAGPHGCAGRPRRAPAGPGAAGAARADHAGAGLHTSVNPRPGWNFGSSHVDYIVPDVIVRRGQNSWNVHLNPAVVPRVRLNRVYEQLFSATAAAARTNWPTTCRMRAGRCATWSSAFPPSSTWRRPSCASSSCSWSSAPWP